MAELDGPDSMDIDQQHQDPPPKDPTIQDDDDPITATYPIFLNPALPSGRQLLVLQYPNRTDDQPRPPPSELRIKPAAGMVEVDIPLDSASGAYDREKGVRWGKSLHASTAAKSGGSHGLAGGFGFGAVQQRGGGGGAGGGAGARKKADQNPDDDDDILEWNEAVRQNKALTTQTLGGQYPVDNDVQYMVGVFQGKNLHLTPVSSMVHLRPQLHHIDAATHLDRRAAGHDSAPGAPSSGPGGSSGGGGASGSSGPGAKAIHMTIKNTTEGDGVATETMADRLRAVQSEPWRKLRYTDENDEAAWDVYNESLFLQSAVTAEDDENQPAAGDGQKKQQAEPSVPRFATRWGEQELLEAVSGIAKQDTMDPQSSKNKAKVKVKADPESQQQQQSDPKEQPAARAPRATRGRGGAAPRRAGRPKAAGS